MQGLPQLEPAIMAGLFWPATPNLASPHPAEPGLIAQREALAAALSGALAPLRDYLRLWAAHEPLLQLDPDARVAELAAKGQDLTLAEVKAEASTPRGFRGAAMCSSCGCMSFLSQDACTWPAAWQAFMPSQCKAL